MNKILFFICIFFIFITPLFSQRINVDKMQNMFDYLDVGIRIEDKYDYIVFYDDIEIVSTDLISRLSYILRSIENFIKSENLQISILRKYHFICYVNENNRALEIVMKSDWLISYYTLRNSYDRSDMLIEFFYEKYSYFQSEQQVQQYR